MIGDENPYRAPEPSTTTPKSTRPTSVRAWVMVWLCAAAAISYIHRNSIAVAEEAIRIDLGLSKPQMGWVLGSFFWGYAILQIPSGWVGDRFGSRGPLALFSAAWSVATGLMALMTGYASLVALRLTCGAAQAGLFPCSTKTMVDWLPPTRRGLASGALGSCMSLGAALALPLTGALLEHGLGWRTVLGLYVAPGLAWAIGFYVWFRDRPEEHPGVNAAELALIRDQASPAEAASGDETRRTTPWPLILSSAPLWFLSAQQFFRAAGYMFYASWFPTFLKETYSVSTEQSGWLTSLPLLAVVIGSPIGGILADRVLARTGSRRLSRQGVGAASMLLSALMIWPACSIADPLPAVLVFSLGSFFASWGGAVAYAASMDLGGRHVATAFAIMNMSGNFGAAAFPGIAAELQTRTNSWNAVLTMFLLIYVAAAVCWLFADVNRPIEKRSSER
jgi:sugar phosphate permease